MDRMYAKSSEEVRESRSVKVQHLEGKMDNGLKQRHTCRFVTYYNVYSLLTIDSLNQSTSGMLKECAEGVAGKSHGIKCSQCFKSHIEAWGIDDDETNHNPAGVQRSRDDCGAPRSAANHKLNLIT